MGGDTAPATRTPTQHPNLSGLFVRELEAQEAGAPPVLTAPGDKNTPHTRTLRKDRPRIREMKVSQLLAISTCSTKKKPTPSRPQPYRFPAGPLGMITDCCGTHTSVTPLCRDITRDGVCDITIRPFCCNKAGDRDCERSRQVACMPEVLVAASHEAVRKRLGRTQLGDISARRKLGVARCTRSSGGVEVFRSLVSVTLLTAALSRVRRSSRADDAEPAY